LRPVRVGSRAVDRTGTLSFYATSAFFARGGLGSPEPPPAPGWRERWLVRLEPVLTALGFPAGSDVAAVFRRA
jgi:hypothetical protein